ncbi:sterol-sensing domain of SREBP cleavage-activation-domain-containing protein [Phyllosticta citriasiana]|uniref:sterol-sensing domain of SREBP cleavage-activation-domain-containing protein n=1 Tax=Phyllosticta citriasiana TaxID=595635 RepID=UPI0030FD3B3C
MIWYLLYAFRGTTEPPKLSPDHPIRKAFASYGTATARHWLFSLLLSVAVAVFLCYPVVFLYESPAASTLPHHAWTSVRTYDGNPNTPPDVEMRQLWVHGSYMKALDLVILRKALDIQNRLIGPGFGADLGRLRAAQTSAGCCSSFVSNDTSWGCHSPLMYWNCSLDAMDADSDILHTINTQRGRRSSYNFTLQPVSVFAGKSFNGTSLLAADALVITIFDRSGGKIAEEFDRRSRSLAREPSEDWLFYPKAGSTYRNRLYEFRYQPLSTNDTWTLISAYSLMLFYVLYSLRKLKAVKSVFGLFCTVLAQMFISICSSFTICGILKINLAQVPGEAYPFVVLVIGLENMFRLINAVLESPAHVPTVSRVANALGDVGHLSLAAAAQNLFILYLLSNVVSPSVASACTFAAVALVFDFVFHLTFFVAVLSVDVRRMELQDSLDRINLATHRKSVSTTRPERRTWGGAFVHGTLRPSTRIAGTVAMVSFILALNWHFFDHDRRNVSLVTWLQNLRSPRHPSIDPVPPPPINQARTPEAWLKMQDHTASRELIKFVKPGHPSFIARVYEPLTVVMKGADRRRASNQAPSVLRAFREMAETHFFPFALAIVFAIAAVTLLMNYLLWNELPDDDVDSGPGEELPLSVQSLPKSHKLDIVKITPCGEGHFISVSLDRLTSIWFLDQRTHTYSNVVLHTANLQPPLWPIVAATIDDSGHWVAILTDLGRVALWSLSETRFVKSRVLDLRGQAPSIFTFSFHQIEDVERLSLVVVTPDGRLTNLDFRTGQLWGHQVSDGPLAHASLSFCIKSQPTVVSVAKTGTITLTFRLSGDWVTENLDAKNIKANAHVPNAFGSPSKVRYAVPIPSLCMVAAVKSCEVDLIDIPTRSVVFTFQTGQIKGQSLRIFHAHRRICGCHSPSVQHFSVAYTDADTLSCLVQTYLAAPDGTNGLICLRPPSSPQERVPCSGLEGAVETVHEISNPGSWEVTCVPAIVGIRKRQSTDAPDVKTSSCDASYFNMSVGSSLRPYQNGVLKRRHQNSFSRLNQSLAVNGCHRRPPRPRRESSSSSSTETEDWEAWTLSAMGVLHTTPLFPRPRRDSVGDEMDGSEESQEDQLFVANPGPMVRVGKRRMAVGFGNSLKIITLGQEKFDEDPPDDPATASLSWRKKAIQRRGEKLNAEKQLQQQQQQQQHQQHQHQHQQQQNQHLVMD